LKPAFVWLTDHAKNLPHDLTVCIARADVPEQLDLRFLVGVTAIVEGPDQARVDRIAAACKPFARRVIATVCPRWDATRITDTEGVMAWN
jgi:hypothetical protein